MSHLKEFQSQFIQTVVDGHSRSELLNDVKPAGGIKTSKQSLDVHRDGYYARLTSALGQYFESLWWFLGDDRFFDFCRDYIDAHPSPFYNLNQYGSEMGQFVRQRPEIESLPFLVDLADFELAFARTFQLPPRKPLATEWIQSDEKSFEARWQLAPMEFLKCRFNAHELWRLRDMPQKEVENIPDEPGEFNYLLFKLESLVYVRALSDKSFQLLQEMSQTQRTVIELLETWEQQEMAQPEEVSELFNILFSEGLVDELVY